MRKLLIVGLFVNAALLAGNWYEHSAIAESGGGAGVEPCKADPTKYSLDTNNDGSIDVSDFVFGLRWFFDGNEAPLVCLDSSDLEARLAQAEAELAQAQEDLEAVIEDIPPPTGPSWLMVQDSEGVSFDFDEALDEECSSEAFWSGTMTMTGADPDTLWFTDRPNRLAYTAGTAEFISGFGETFSESTGGNPNAVLNWEDADDGTEKHAVIELRYVDATSPSYDPDSAVLTYSVCGLRLDDPGTRDPLPDIEQSQPPVDVNAEGKLGLFIDSVTLSSCSLKSYLAACPDTINIPCNFGSCLCETALGADLCARCGHRDGPVGCN
jgi:hypothetical protein